MLISVKLLIPGFLKTGLAKISTHSTTWQFKTTKPVQRPIKNIYLTPGSKLLILRSIPTGPILKRRKFQNIYSVIRLREVSNRCQFSLEIFKLSELQRKSALLRLKQLAKHYFFRAPINNRISHGIDIKLNETECTNYHLLICKNRPMVQCHQSPLKLDLDPIFLSRELLF